MSEKSYPTDAAKFRVAMHEALLGLEEGGIPIGAALFDEHGKLLGSGHNLRVQEDNPAVHGETAAFINAGRQRSYRKTTMVTTLSPCWYCSGLIRQFGIGRLIVGDTENFFGGQDWLAENGTEVITINDPEMIRVMGDFIEANPVLWNEDIGEE
ncbi:nucleoside deaminase [Glaciihabitans sp. dw_435]|uniref:nucleoside deaminase n=1 Tax=Glaciihabitans sp. dw_435 TaxID=2720081 RepID=UPI001BD26B71|nr:nucleoside deaminase [Glaciihabitans sp. dw_435]